MKLLILALIWISFAACSSDESGVKHKKHIDKPDGRLILDGTGLLVLDEKKAYSFSFSVGGGYSCEKYRYAINNEKKLEAANFTNMDYPARSILSIGSVDLEKGINTIFLEADCECGKVYSEHFVFVVESNSAEITDAESIIRTQPETISKGTTFKVFHLTLGYDPVSFSCSGCKDVTYKNGYYEATAGDTEEIILSVSGITEEGTTKTLATRTIELE